MGAFKKWLENNSSSETTGAFVPNRATPILVSDEDAEQGYLPIIQRQAEEINNSIVNPLEFIANLYPLRRKTMEQILAAWKDFYASLGISNEGIFQPKATLQQNLSQIWGPHIQEPNRVTPQWNHPAMPQIANNMVTLELLPRAKQLKEIMDGFGVPKVPKQKFDIFFGLLNQQSELFDWLSKYKQTPNIPPQSPEKTTFGGSRKPVRPVLPSTRQLNQRQLNRQEIP